ncbi:MAG: protein kinase [Planctomycetes bacterium]|nr:protein kinase [Planctomycetota bacterium]
MTDLDDLLDTFDCEWRAEGPPPDLMTFVDRAEHSGVPTAVVLRELIAIDMEYRWREAAPSPAQANNADEPVRLPWDTGYGGFPARPTVEDYSRRWPQISGGQEPPVELIAEEYRIRHRWGDRPAAEEYLRRFGDCPALRESLEDVRRELALDTAGDGMTAAFATTDDSEDTALHGAETQPPLGRALGRYRLIRPLGKGGMGEVYLGEDTHLGRRIALKVPHNDEQERRRERFVNEAKAVATLRHPGICPVFDAGEIDGQPFLTMAYIEGETLRERWKRQARRSLAEDLAVLARVAQAMQAAHEAGIVHRDLKPANVMLTEAGEPVVMDFGLAYREARTPDERITQTGETFGSPAYMSPEQFDGPSRCVGPASDVYSLGVMLYEALTGRLPFRGSVAAILAQIGRDRPQRPSSLVEHVDCELEQLCLQMLARNPADRPQSMNEIAERLTTIRCRLETAGPIVASPSCLSSWRRIVRGRASAVAAALLLLLGLLAFAVQSLRGTDDASARTHSRRVPITPADRSPATTVEGSALSFDGIDDYVVTPVVYDGSHPVTVEAWVSPADRWGNGTVLSNANACGIYLHQSYGERNRTRRWAVWIGDSAENGWIACAHAAAPFAHQRTHIAAVWDQSQIAIYVNGVRQQGAGAPLARMPAVDRPFLIGTKHSEVGDVQHSVFSNSWFHGEIDEVRLSRTARYSEDFTPQARWEPDDATIALYHFDEGEGDTLHDASGNGHYAKIVGASWVVAATMNEAGEFAERFERFAAEVRRPQPPCSGPALHFSERAAVVLPPLQFDFTQPFTIEAWVQPESEFAWSDWRRVIAHVGPLSLNIQRFHDVFAFQVWDSGSGLNVTSHWPDTALYDRRTHVAAQWDGAELGLFLNGRRSPALPKRRNLAAAATNELLIGALSNASAEQLVLGRRANGKSVFGGRIDRFRLSRGTRYSGDFEPDDFGADRATVVLYDFHEGRGNVLHDVSGNRHHGEIVGAQWVYPADSANLQSRSAASTPGERAD